LFEETQSAEEIKNCMMTLKNEVARAESRKQQSSEEFHKNEPSHSQTLPYSFDC
jgi:hypothetical protein